LTGRVRRWTGRRKRGRGERTLRLRWTATDALRDSPRTLRAASQAPARCDHRFDIVDETRGVREGRGAALARRREACDGFIGRLEGTMKASEEQQSAVRVEERATDFRLNSHASYRRNDQRSLARAPLSAQHVQRASNSNQPWRTTSGRAPREVVTLLLRPQQAAEEDRR
jgi:hypothetical protein